MMLSLLSSHSSPRYTRFSIHIKRSWGGLGGGLWGVTSCSSHLSACVMWKHMCHSCTSCGAEEATCLSCQSSDTHSITASPGRARRARITAVTLQTHGGRVFLRHTVMRVNAHARKYVRNSEARRDATAGETEIRHDTFRYVAEEFDIFYQIPFRNLLICRAQH